MTDSAIPEDVQRFISQHVDSMDQLEILLLLRATAPKEWTADAVARELRIDPAASAERLADLQARGLLAAIVGARVPAYRYEPATTDLARAVAGLAIAYAERRVRVVDLIFSKPIDHIRVFSDAFRWRKGND